MEHNEPVGSKAEAKRIVRDITDRKVVALNAALDRG